MDHGDLTLSYTTDEICMVSIPPEPLFSVNDFPDNISDIVSDPICDFSSDRLEKDPFGDHTFSTGDVLHSTALSDTDGEEQHLVDLGYGGTTCTPRSTSPQQASPIRPLPVGPHRYADYIRDLWPNPDRGFEALAPSHHSLYLTVRQSNLPNYLSARIPVPSDLNCSMWDILLKGYSDAEITDYLRFGWPSSYTAPVPPRLTHTNHQSAISYKQEVDRFVAKEVEKGAMLGPFPEPPFVEWTQTSPLLMVPKKDSDRRRVVIDLSFPEGHSVNTGIAKNIFQGVPFSYSLPTVHNFAQLVMKHGPGCYLWKADLQRAYRRLRSDPLDYPLMCIRHNNEYYIDICPSFGGRGSAAAQQRVSRAVCHLMTEAGFPTLAYVDDFGGCLPDFHTAMSAFAHFEHLTSTLGLSLAPEKSTFPTTRLEWLGFMIDSVAMEITVPQQKLDEVLNLNTEWETRHRASRKDFQVLAGKLNHLAQCILPARRFMSRILAALRSSPRVGTRLIDENVRRDIAWFNSFARSFNGKLLLVDNPPVFPIQCDACLRGLFFFPRMPTTRPPSPPRSLRPIIYLN